MVRGLHVPLVTPFDEDGAVDLAALERLAARGARRRRRRAGRPGHDGRGVVAGRARARRGRRGARARRRRARRRAHRRRGTNDTRTTIARHEALAEVDGVTASLAVVPYYVRPSEAAIVAHFQAVAARSPVPARPLQHPLPHGARARRGGPARAGRHRRHRRPQAGRGAARRRHAAAAGRRAVGLRRAVRRRRLHPAAAAHGRARRDRRLGAPVHRALRRARSPPRPPGASTTRARHAEALLALVLALFAEPSPAVLKAMLHEAGRIATPDVRMPLQAGLAGRRSSALGEAHLPVRARALLRALDEVQALHRRAGRGA